MSDPAIALCDQARSGDLDAASELVSLHYERIFAWFRRLCGHDADAADLTQKAFCKAWATLHRYEGRSSFSTWLHGIGYHVYARPRLAAGTNSFDDTTELLRLRNEVRQLRAVPQEVARLRAANDQLAAEIKSGSAAGELTEMEGYQPKESWKDSGLGSPEATVQTFFRAVRDQDVARLLQCLSEPGTLALDLWLDAKTGQLRPSSVGALQTLGLVQGYRIEARNSAAPEQVALSLRAKTGGAVLVLVLRKFGEDWKIDR